MLRFVHGWGFDASLWDGVRAALGAVPASVVDLGYFGDPVEPVQDSVPFIAVGHSLGILHLLADLPANCAGLVAINGFDRFAGDAQDATAVPRRVVDRMITRLQQQPKHVLADFRQRCGSDAPLPGPICLQSLLSGLERLRDADERAAARRLQCPVLILHGADDAILPPPMRAAVFSGCADVERHELPEHGHLLPLTAASWCAGHIRAFAARQNVTL